MPGEVDTRAERQVEEGQARQPAPRVEEDPLYELSLSLVQQGRWADAQDALADLQVRYPESEAVRGLWEELMLHLSAERTWGEEKRRQARRKPRPRTVRVLIVANVVLYLLLALLWLLLQLSKLLS
jgi:hypothetical protein